MIQSRYDVIIVGTGVAGCFAALHLPSDRKILMITKAAREESDSFLAQGGICVQKNDEDFDAFMEDTMRAGHYENSREAVEIMIRSSRKVIEELVNWGVDFAHGDEGFLMTREGAHSTNRILYHDDITGKEITQKLLAQVEKCDNISLLENTTMLDILEENGVCRGIVLHTSEGEVCPVESDFVVWACGGIGGIYEHSTNYPHLQGDALAISLRRGIRLRNVNYVQIHPTTLYTKKPGRSFLISESVRGEGAKLYNKRGERFVNELLPRDVVARAILEEMEKDQMPHVWLSLKPITHLDVKKRFPNIYQKCLDEGYDISKEPIPVVPAQHYFMGGVDVDSDSMTSMDCLYAAGETSCNGVHGANRLASNSLLESLVFAERAALKITERMKDMPRREEAESAEQIWNRYGLYPEAYADLARLGQENKKLIWNEIRKVEKKDEPNHRQTKCG